jgi:hypothetical protein
MGGGSSTPTYGAGVSGAGGGRIIPGTASGVLSVNFSPANSTLLGPRYGYAGGGAGQVGTSSSIPGYGAGGGGWGAAGGLQIASETLIDTDPPGTLVGPNGLGGAGGKAINTNGFAVTFIGGADRIFGVVG